MNTMKQWLLMLALCAPAAAIRAETLVTHYFEGDVSHSTSSLVNVGDRLTGTFTYDLDWDDLSPNNPNSFFYFFPPGWALEEFPVGSPIGMSYSVGSLSHHAQEYVELIVDNDTPEDFLYFGSDSLGGGPDGGGLGLSGGYLELLDPTGVAFSADRPPAQLDLAAFSQITFWGTDGNGTFLATIDVLHTIPEPSPFVLLIAGSLVCIAARVRRYRQIGGNNVPSP